MIKTLDKQVYKPKITHIIGALLYIYLLYKLTANPLDIRIKAL